MSFRSLGGYQIDCHFPPVADKPRFLPDSDAHRPTLADDTPRWTHTGNDIIVPSGATSHRDIDPRPLSPFLMSFMGQTWMPIGAPPRLLTSEQGNFSRETGSHRRRPLLLPGESTPIMMMSSLPRSRFQTWMTPLLTDVGGLTESLSQMDWKHYLSGTELSRDSLRYLQVNNIPVPETKRRDFHRFHRSCQSC